MTDVYFDFQNASENMFQIYSLLARSWHFRYILLTSAFFGVQISYGSAKTEKSHIQVPELLTLPHVPDCYSPAPINPIICFKYSGEQLEPMSGFIFDFSG